MRLHRHNISDRKIAGFTLFDNGYTPAEVSKRLGVTEATTCSWYASWLSQFKATHEPIQPINQEVKCYWETEAELEDSFNPYYTYEDLSREEKAIYNGLL